MSLLNDAIDRLLGNETKLDKLVNGDSQTVVQTDNGPVPSVSKVIFDAQEKIDSFIPDLTGKEVKTAKDAVDGYAGLGSDFMLRIKNMAGTVASYVTSDATQERLHVLQDKNGVVAHLSDIPEPEDRTSLLEKLGVSDIEEPATLESLGAQPNLGYVPLDVRMGDQPEGFPKLDENLKLDPKYFPDSAEAILLYPTLADFPEEGMSKRIYIDEATSRPYTWDGDSYEALKVDIGNTDTIDEGEVNKFFTMGRVLDGLLDGFNMIASGYVTGEDTLLIALGKLQRLVTDVQTKFGEYAALTGAIFTGEVQVPTIDASVASKDAVNSEALKVVTDSLVENLNVSIGLRELLINKAINFVTLDDVLYPTTKAVSSYVTERMANVVRDRGMWSPATNLYPTTGGTGAGGAVEASNLWYISAAGTIGGINLDKGDTIRALENNPGQDNAKWAIAETNFGYVPAMNTGGNASGTWGISTTGTVKVTDAANANVAYYLTFASGPNAQSALSGDTELSYNPSTNTLSVPIVSTNRISSPSAAAIEFVVNGFKQAEIGARAGADNYVRMRGGLSGQGPAISAVGASADVNLTLQAQGAGVVLVQSVAQFAEGTINQTSDKGTVATGTVTFDVRQSSVQKLTVGGDLTIAFTGWAANGYFSAVFVELINGGSAAVSIPGVNWILPTTGKPAASFSAYLTAIGRSPATLQVIGHDWLLLWSTDGGATINGRM